MTLDTSFDAAILPIRFGAGRSPVHGNPDTLDALIAPLAGPDHIAAAIPFPDPKKVQAEALQMRGLRRQRQKLRDSGKSAEEVQTEIDQLRKRRRARREQIVRATFARWTETEDGLRERLVRFWADHFTVTGLVSGFSGTEGLYTEHAIRPHVAGRFSDLLRSAILHPAMVIYLDQARSIGPESPAARRSKSAGLNENLARELMELHTLGVDGPYLQKDVRQLAELLTGLTATPIAGLGFNPRRVEPGQETVLGKSYGGRTPSIQHIEQVLDDLAAHPQTAKHIARKMAVHFVADAPSDALVAHVEARWLETDGDLLAVTTALIEHPDARQPELRKARQPLDFVGAAFRSLGVSSDRILGFPRRKLRREVMYPVAAMGQPWDRPGGPDGWPEEEDHWITPQGLAIRINWSMAMSRLTGGKLPDPRKYAEVALGPLADEAVLFAARSAETRAEGVGLVAASPAFQRR